MNLFSTTIKLHLLAILKSPSFAGAKLESDVSLGVHQKDVALNSFFNEEVEIQGNTLLSNVSLVNESNITHKEKEVAVYMEPRVDKYTGVLPRAVCQELILLGERAGFKVVEESIDDDDDGYDVEVNEVEKQKIPSQSIDVLDYIPEEDRSYIANGPIYFVLQPYLNRFADLVKKSRKREEQEFLYPDDPDREPRLDWIFFRKYSPTCDRNSLKPHQDSNVFTLNIALNDDFEGGGFFYIKPPEQKIMSHDTRPEFSEHIETYDWTNSIKRENTSDVVFPYMNAGDVIVHNFTVMHGVAPLEKGERYSLALFYDMDNPIIDDMKPTSFPVEFYHEIQDVKIKLVYVERASNGEIVIEEVMIDEFHPFVRFAFDTYEGHTFQAVVDETNEVLAEFVASEKQRIYSVVKDAKIPHSEL